MIIFLLGKVYTLYRVNKYEQLINYWCGIEVWALSVKHDENGLDSKSGQQKAMLLPAWINPSQSFLSTSSDHQYVLSLIGETSSLAVLCISIASFVMYPHCFFCHSRLWRPLTSAVIIPSMEFLSSLLITLPYHRNLASCILSVMYATSSIFLMTSFLFLSFSETPSQHSHFCSLQ